ncbi:ISEcp1 transposase [Candidatus Omnitrophus magneticus]|uniref:ISEcp1 transposase n=1 Tax=Candidatus Omnitrophus magneticus TaxID=1609969 RepID=A0A0F0CJ05_9BACT|nr:ISEcp1 transposase [Candidatus Omnitrophus magneticus]KJJ84240.1 ISEcp1 transposase [Candidatus Omnitrophus magneticus]
MFNRIKTLGLVENLSAGLWKYLDILIPWSEIKEDWIGFDSTVIERYGIQEGSKKGYNPKKKGRPSHHPLMAFLNKNKYIIQLWNRSGNANSVNNIHNFFEETMARIANRISVLGILADSGFYDKNFIEMLENTNKQYIIAVRLYSTVQSKIESITNWQEITKGIEIAEFEFEHKEWNMKRRYIVVRQSIQERENATGKQLTFFPDLKEYRYSVWITNSKEKAEEVWHCYKERANDENTIKEFKEDFALGGFCLNNFYATESAMLIRMLVYNIFVLFRFAVMGQRETRERLKTLRYKFFVVPAHFGKHGRESLLRLSVTTEHIRQKFRQFFKNIEQHIFNCNAFENTVVN